MSRPALSVLAAALCCCWSAASPLGAEAAPTDAGRIEVLNADSYLRVHIGWKTTVIAGADGQLRLPTVGKEPKPVREVQSNPPPADWIQPGFDDRLWAREHAPLAINWWHNGGYGASDYHLICARGRFMVEDPARVKDLRLALSFYGGAAAYLNGKEIARAHLPAGELKPEALAEKYPDEAYVNAEGFLLQDPKADAERFARRIRKLEAAVPSAALVRGVNVLAIELHRAPLAEVYLNTKFKTLTYHGTPGAWCHVALDDLALTAEPGAAVTPNVARPKSPQVWTANAHETLLQWHYGDPCEAPGLKLLGARGGTVGGWVVISSADAIREARASAGDLASADGGKLPAGAVRLYYAEPCEAARTFNGNPGFDGLLDEPPAEAKVSSAAPKVAWRLPYALLRSPPVPGASVPVWVSVRVPGDAKPGLYSGTVMVQAAGLKPTAVPISLKVMEWQLPDPGGLASRNNLYQSHETAALYYQVPLWSDRHFELLGQLLEMSKGLGNRLCMVHLIKGAYHLNNREGMVRWIRKGENEYDYDFSIFDRYLDLYEKKIGKPAVLLLSAFHPYVDAKDKTGKFNSATVSLLLPGGAGKVEDLRVPDYGTPESVAFWKPVFGEILKRLEQRGWKDVAVIGTPSDNGPKTAEPISMFKEVWPECRLMFSGHPNPTFYNTRDKVRVPVTCREHVWSAGVLYNPDHNQYVKDWKGGAYPMPWKRDAMNQEWGFMRYGVACIYALYESSRAVAWRMVEESTLQGNLCGVGRVGMDFWPLPVEGKPGRYQALSGDEGMHLGPSASTRMFFYPGPRGPAPTGRSEVFREGLQLREAMIFLQRALDSGKADGERARKIRGLLDERARHYLRTHEGSYMLWVAFEGSGWQERDERLLALCAEVAGEAGSNSEGVRK